VLDGFKNFSFDFFEPSEGRQWFALTYLLTSANFFTDVRKVNLPTHGVHVSVDIKGRVKMVSECTVTLIRKALEIMDIVVQLRRFIFILIVMRNFGRFAYSRTVLFYQITFIKVVDAREVTS
jgi:hypothetical protein